MQPYPTSLPIDPSAPAADDNADRPYPDPVRPEPEPFEVAPIGAALDGLSTPGRDLAGFAPSDRFLAVGAPGWHGLGTVIERDKAPSVEAALKAVLPWEVAVVPALWSPEPIHCPIGGEQFAMPARPAPGQVVLRVDPPEGDDFDVQRTPLAVVGTTFRPLLNRDFIALAAAADGVEGARLETAGSLRGGAKVFCLLRVGQYDVGGGPTEEFLAFLNGHDGTRALRIFRTTVRVVCENTELHAEDKAAGAGVTVLHRQGIDAAVVALRESIGRSVEGFFKVQEEDRALVGAMVPDADTLDGFHRAAWAAYTGRPAPTGPGMTAGGARAWTTFLAVREAWRSEFESDRSGPSGTWYAALQSVTRWADHGGRRVKDRTADRLFGSGAAFKAEVRRLALAGAL